MLSEKRFAWNAGKNDYLKATRNITFEEVIENIHEGNLLAVVNHPNKERYPNQHIFVLMINDYAWIIPFVESEHEIFLKTAIPSRKMTKQYLRK